MHSTRKVLWAVLLIVPLLIGGRVLAADVDDYVPEVTDRVARISFVSGDVQIRRDGSQDWERAALNLPVVEGDEITTDGGRFEIQFNSYTFLRVAENSYLKIETLRDEGIAVSLPQGNLSLRVNDFDPARGYFEIDAPKTTVAVQKSGIYRVDAGPTGSASVRVTASDGGEARVYTDAAGFAVKNGRSAKINIDGAYAGEWEMADASRFADEFDSFALDRDAVIAKRLAQAYYDKYYDRDIYGAEDLGDYGEWIHTQKYGYVWRPYRSATSSYSDWSPYRYGQWRWIPPYGWTWVNDEPWGWATYHYGRWVWDDGSWYWTPYGYYRHSRSWWSPALVVVNVINSNICWYPLPYNYGYYDYNYSYYSHGGRRHRGGNNNWGGNHNGGGSWGGNNPSGVTPTPTPGSQPPGKIVIGGRNISQPPLANVPANAVVSVAMSDFGRDKRGFQTAPPMLAKSLLSKVPDEPVKAAPELPTYRDLNGKVSQEIRSVRPPMTKVDTISTGAADRKKDAPLDQELRKSRIFGNRPPLEINTGRGDIRPVPSAEPDTRPTGAVGRPPKVDSDDKPSRQAPVYAPPTRQAPEQPAEPVKEPVKERPRRDDPIRQPSNDSQPKPRYEPPPQRNPEPPRTEQPKPRYDPPPQRNDPPPRSEPTKRSDPPPSKSEPSKPEPSTKKGKDG